MLLRSVTTTLPPPTNHKHFVSRLKLNVFRGHVQLPRIWQAALVTSKGDGRVRGFRVEARRVEIGLRP